MESAVVDFRKLEKEVAASVEKEGRRRRENDAKFQAVEQGCDYEQFRALVDFKGKNLQSLERDESDLSTIYRPHRGERSKVASRHYNTDRTAEVGAEAATLVTTQTVPKSAHQFQRDWIRQCKSVEDRCTFLNRIPVRKFQKIFKSDIDSVLLTEILAALRDGLQQPTAAVGAPTQAAVPDGHGGGEMSTSGGGGSGEAAGLRNAQQAAQLKVSEQMTQAQAPAPTLAPATPSPTVVDSSAALMSGSNALGILTGIASIKRFDLTVQFFTEDDKALVRQVASAIADCDDGADAAVLEDVVGKFNAAI